MTGFIRALDRFWFAPARPQSLAALRLLIGTYALIDLLNRQKSFLSVAASRSSLFEPVGPVALLRSPLPVTTFEVLLNLTYLAGLAFLLGWRFRWTGPLFGLLYLFVMSYRQSWMMIYHSDNLPVLHVLILGLSPAADAFSLDALFRRPRRMGRIKGLWRSRRLDGDWEYGAPVRLLATATVATYFVSGVAKVAGPLGLGWIGGSSMLAQIRFDGLRKELLAGGASPLIYALNDQTVLFTLLGVGTLLLELGAPVALLSRPLGWAWSFGVLGMHWSILFIMGITFHYQLIGLPFTPFFPVERPIALLLGLAQRVRQRLPRASLIGDRAAVSRPQVRSRRGGLLRRLAARHVIIVSLAVAGLTGVSWLALNRTKSQPPTPPVICPAPCERQEIVWTGDILLGDAAQRRLDERRDYRWPFEQVEHLLSGSFAIGNLEGPITRRTGPYFPNQRWSYNMQPEAADALAAVGFRAVGISNNHVLDRGPEGLTDTVRELRTAGIQPFGAGQNEDEASAPLWIDLPHGRLAVLAFSGPWSAGQIADGSKAGTVPIEQARIAALAQRARSSGASWVAAFVHWGDNYATVTPRQRRQAEQFAEAGYDLVVGHHAHVPQPVERIGKTVVLYSLGNFVFTTSGRFTPELPGLGLVARSRFGADGLQALELDCIAVDNDFVKFQPRPCDSAEATQTFASLGDQVIQQGDRALVRLPVSAARPPPPVILSLPKDHVATH